MAWRCVVLPELSSSTSSTIIARTAFAVSKFKCKQMILWSVEHKAAQEKKMHTNLKAVEFDTSFIVHPWLIGKVGGAFGCYLHHHNSSIASNPSALSDVCVS